MKTDSFLNTMDIKDPGKASHYTNEKKKQKKNKHLDESITLLYKLGRVLSVFITVESI